MTLRTTLHVRPVAAADAGILRYLLTAALGDDAYAKQAIGALCLALDGENSESRGLVAIVGGNVAGVVLYGEVAGTERAGEVHCIVVASCEEERYVGRCLCAAAIADLTERGVRFVTAELPADSTATAECGLLLNAGFTEETRIRDFYRDGVDLIVFRREIER